MEKTVFKIKKSDSVTGTGFLCIINNQDNTSKSQVLITCNHVLDINDIQVGKVISIFSEENGHLKLKNIKINKLRKTYTSKENDVTIIEIKKIDNFDEKDMLTIDEDIFSNNYKIYSNKFIYMIHYPKGLEVKYSSDKIMYISEDKDEIKHKCPTDSGSSGAPIINLELLEFIVVPKINIIME